MRIRAWRIELKKLTIALLCIALCLSLCACTGVGNKTPDSFNITKGARQCYAVSGDNVITATQSVFCVYDAEGNETVRTQCDLQYPTVTKSENAAVIYDVGGTSVFFDDGSEITTDGMIISADLSESGKLALCTEEAGYKASVTVYDGLKAVYKWYSAENWVLDAAVSEDGKSLAVLCSGADGASIHMFELTGEEEVGMLPVNESAANICWVDGNACSISDSGLSFCSRQGKDEGSFDFEGQSLGEYAVCDDFILLELREHSFGGPGMLVGVDENGRELSREQLDAEIVGIDSGDAIAVQTQNEVIIFDDDMKMLAKAETAGAERVLLYKEGNVICLGAGIANITDY